jgi:hypothetical protein
MTSFLHHLPLGSLHQHLRVPISFTLAASPPSSSSLAGSLLVVEVVGSGVHLAYGGEDAFKVGEDVEHREGYEGSELSILFSCFEIFIMVFC